MTTMLNHSETDPMDEPHSFVPHHTREGLLNYINLGIPPGSFLTAVLSNNLKQACGRADHINSRHITTIVAWLYNYAPSGCWGSEQAMLDHVSKLRGDTDA